MSSSCTGALAAGQGCECPSRNRAARRAARGARHRENWQSRGEGAQSLCVPGSCASSWAGAQLPLWKRGQGYLAEGMKQFDWGREWLRNAKRRGREVRGFAASVVKCAVVERAQEGISR